MSEPNPNPNPGPAPNLYSDRDVEARSRHIHALHSFLHLFEAGIVTFEPSMEGCHRWAVQSPDSFLSTPLFHEHWQTALTCAMRLHATEDTFARWQASLAIVAHEFAGDLCDDDDDDGDWDDDDDGDWDDDGDDDDEDDGDGDGDGKEESDG